MNEHPILFSSEMIVAILAGKKTQTRRIAKKDKCPYGEVGDKMWVRETFGVHNGKVYYRATDEKSAPDEAKWKPSIHMKREYARILLEITDVKKEKLNEISYHDAVCEGVSVKPGTTNWTDYMNEKRSVSSPVKAFESLWRALHGNRAWKENPEVWVVEFKLLNAA